MISLVHQTRVSTMADGHLVVLRWVGHPIPMRRAARLPGMLRRGHQTHMLQMGGRRLLGMHRPGLRTHTPMVIAHLLGMRIPGLRTLMHPAAAVVGGRLAVVGVEPHQGGQLVAGVEPLLGGQMVLRAGVQVVVKDGETHLLNVRLHGATPGYVRSP